MSSQSRSDPRNDKSRQRVIVPADKSAEEAISPSTPSPPPPPPTDDTPTIISRITPAPAAVSGDNPADVRGRRLAHFELIEPIGVGGMAAVIRARDTQLDRFVALKILPPEMAADPENVRRFHQEARSAAKLDHENIARVFYCGEDQRLHFIAFEFVEGENLRDVLQQRGRLSANEAIHYMLQVAAGLAHAARRGVVHRDIKPSNIIITPNGRAKLVDMGLARSLLQRDNETDLTQSGVTLGTFDYISPEQALEPRDADERSDIYSLGCTFYHVLTGRPPVPEGTAARKLHHHQHVRPTDPRQFVPDLPVEVVQILDRMMAKSPRDRFQSPEHLVHQLLVAARKLGAAPEVPEGVLSVEAALPTPPTGRPLVWAGLAAVAVVGLVMLLDQTPPGGHDSREKPAVQPEQHESAGTGKTGTPETNGPDTTHARAPQTPEVAVYEAPTQPTVQDLVQWLNKHRNEDRIELRLAGDLDLSGSPGEVEKGLFVRARKEVVIRPRDADTRPTLRLRYDGASQSRPLIALTIQTGGTSLVEGVRFVIDGRESAETEMVALLLTGGGTHKVQQCEFVQAEPSRRLASVLADAKANRQIVELRQSLFLGFANIRGERDQEGRLSGADRGGQDAVVCRGAVQLEARDCAFGPHAAAFRLEGPPKAAEGKVTLHHCTMLLPPRRSAAFEVGAGTKADLDVSHCLVARLGTEGDGDTVLIRQAEDGGEKVSYWGRGNRYHDLDGYWSVGDDWQTAGWGDFCQRMREGKGDDSRVLPFSPWELDSVRQVEALEGDQPGSAFKVNLAWAAVRVPGGSTRGVIGVEKIPGEAWPPDPLPQVHEKVEDSLPRVLVVEKGVKHSSSNSIFDSLDAAVLDARPGDTILIRHNGELEINPILLNKRGLADLSIKAARRFRPVLTLGEPSETEVALFRLHDGKLRLEGLDFRLKPRKNFRMQTVVALVGDGECVLKDCVVTLERSGETVLALANLAEAGKVMPPDKRPVRDRTLGPKLSLEGCFVRGEGDLFWTRVGRPFGLEVKHTLVALNGTLLHIEVTADAPAPPPGHKALVDLTRTTTYLTGNLVRLSAGKEPRGLVPVTCKAASCLFLPAAATGKPLVLLDGSDSEEKLLRDKFVWEGGKNAYGNYTVLQAQQPAGEEMAALLPRTADFWKTQPGEENSVFGVKLAVAPPIDAPFFEMEPGQFKPPRDASDSGASPTRLPRPAR